MRLIFKMSEIKKIDFMNINEIFAHAIDWHMREKTNTRKLDFRKNMQIFKME